MEWLVPVSLTAFGLAFGSFANVVIWRLPRGESLSSPSSRCPACGTAIAWRDNIPVVSWLMLRGRCRHCQIGISARYPVVELLSGALWLLMWFLYGLSAALFFAIFFSYILLILSFIDLDTMRLPNALVGLLAATGAVGVALSVITGEPMVPLLPGTGWLSEPWVAAAFGLAVGGVLPLAISALYALVRGRQGMGMGDVKLLGTMGIYLGPYVVMSLVLGSFAGAVAAVLVPNAEGVRRKIPFGPFLALGGVACLAVGPGLWAWYAQFL